MLHIINVIVLALIAYVSARDPKIRIAGGTLSSPGQFPYSVEVISQYSDGTAAFCGGNLINNRYVLTAAHCFLEVGTEPSSITVLLGTNDLESSNRIEISATHAIYNPLYDNATAQNDVALVLLSKDIYEGTNVQYALLGTANPPVDTQLTVAGWGLNNNRETAPPAQQSYATLFVVNGDQCVQYFQSFDPNDDLCLFGNDQQPCQGDSGSGLVSQGSDGRYTVYGLVSFGVESCSASNSLNAFTSVAKYYDFIVANGNASAPLPSGNTMLLPGILPSSPEPTSAAEIIGPTSSIPPGSRVTNNAPIVTLSMISLMALFLFLL